MKTYRVRLVVEEEHTGYWTGVKPYTVWRKVPSPAPKLLDEEELAELYREMNLNDNA